MMASKFSLCLTCKLVKQHRISKSLARSNINPFHQGVSHRDSNYKLSESSCSMLLFKYLVELCSDNSQPYNSPFNGISSFIINCDTYILLECSSK